MQDLFGVKELYSVNLRTTSRIEINGVIFEENEPIITFDNIQLAPLTENKIRRSARGGKNNEELITWENTTDVTFSLSEGVISKNGLAILSNSKLIKQENEVFACPFREKVESNEDGKIISKYTINQNEPFFIYDNNGVKVTDYTINNNEIMVGAQYATYHLNYYFDYTDTIEQLIVGQRLIDSCLSLDGLVRFKDDQDGYVKTGIIEIPKVKLMSNLSMRLGKDSGPYVYRFNIMGLPVGNRRNEYVCKITMLNNEIDSDF